MDITFCINRKELIEALKFFEPFIKPQEQNSLDDAEVKTEIQDKVTFEFHGDFVKLCVLYDYLTLERTCPVVVGCGNLSFSLPIADILNNIDCIDVEIHLIDQTRPGLFTPVQQKEGMSILMLAMPMMLA